MTGPATGTSVVGTSVGIVDAHHHLWDPARRRYPWMEGAALAPLRREFATPELRRVTAAAGVTSTVLVQTVSDAAETVEFLATAAASGGLVAGVVGWVDLTGDVPHQLAQLRSGPGGSALVGVRHQVEDEDDPRWLLRPAVRAGSAQVARAGLVTDLLVRTDQLAAATELVDALPGARFVLDHGAKPPVGTAAWPGWAAAVADLARRPNVVCKLSGLFTLVPAAAPAESLTPTLEHLLETFGPRRLVFGTDWPVSTLAAPYADVVARTVAQLAPLSADEREDVLARTARSTYGLPVTA